MDRETRIDDGYEEIDLREIIIVLWKRKIMIAAITAFFVLCGVIVSFRIAPTYETSTTLYLGSFSSNIYNDRSYAKAIMLAEKNLRSDETLAGIIDNYTEGSSRKKLLAFKEAISFRDVDNTNIMEINVQDKNPKQAVLIADRLLNVFMAKSNAMYQEKRQVLTDKIVVLEDAIKNSEGQFKEFQNRFNVLEEGNRGSSVEYELAASRMQQAMIEYESQKISLLEQIQSLEGQLLDYNPAVVLTPAVEPLAPVKPNKRMNVAIAFMLGLCLSTLLAFGLEYLKNNPIKLE
jgi:capsular polysaccharide biosynthesis protein